MFRSAGGQEISARFRPRFQIYIRENAVFAISDIYAIISYIFIVSVNNGKHA